ncbi:unnamed protein product [Pneumocystis jirovecii]|uniref:Uncharacterized protein n=1 Tax=Pneumocystis jirovecii TaxID=42068 RepID=L0PDH6_PNEJI|nr:unnamed protein product [Pneumocystis jirovecii]
MISISEKPPTKSERQHCWEARDIFFHCLDKNSIINPLTQSEKIRLTCLLEEKTFKNSCAKSWKADRIF